MLLHYVQVERKASLDNDKLLITFKTDLATSLKIYAYTTICLNDKQERKIQGGGHIHLLP